MPYLLSFHEKLEISIVILDKIVWMLKVSTLFYIPSIKLFKNFKIVYFHSKIQTACQIVHWFYLPLPRHMNTHTRARTYYTRPDGGKQWQPQTCTRVPPMWGQASLGVIKKDQSGCNLSGSPSPPTPTTTTSLSSPRSSSPPPPPEHSPLLSHCDPPGKWVDVTRIVFPVRWGTFGLLDRTFRIYIIYNNWNV